MASGMATASYELRFDSGRICLDLTATTHPDERLDSAGRLRAWVVASGLVPADTPLISVDTLWLLGFRELEQQHVPRLLALIHARRRERREVPHRHRNEVIDAFG